MKKLIILGVAAVLAGTSSLLAADAKAVWDKECAKCHGTTGKGDSKMGQKLGVKDYTDPKVQAAMKDEEMVKAIKEGVKKDGKTTMKGYPDYTDQQVKDLVAYVRAMK